MSGLIWTPKIAATDRRALCARLRCDAVWDRMSGGKPWEVYWHSQLIGGGC